ncbi:MAG: hypothetical protein WAU70_07225 [Flavobacteriales bacterium]
MTGPWIELRRIVESIAPALQAISDAQAATPRAPGKWSPKEVIAFKTPGEGVAVTLRYFMNDHVDHLKHHLRQVLPDHPSLT